MPLSCWIEHACTPRATLGADKLAALVRASILAEVVSAEFREAQPDMAEDAMLITERVETLSGDCHDQRITVAELRQRAAVLRDLEAACTACPASTTGKAWGCLLSLSFPVSRVAEEWLVSLVPAENTLCGQFFRKSCDLMEYGNCALIGQWREAGILAAVRPAEASGITSDQILHALLMSGELAPQNALALLLGLGLLRTSDSASCDEALLQIESVQTGLLDASQLSLELCLPEVPAGDDRSVNELRGLFLALFRALSCGDTLAVRTSVRDT